MNRNTEILIRNGYLPIPGNGESELPHVELATVMCNLMHYGFQLSHRGFNMLRTCSSEDVQKWWVECEKAFKSITGDDLKMGDFVVYKNFPEETLKMSEAEYWIKQTLMYWGLPNELFTEDEKQREPLDENIKLKVLQPAGEATLQEIYLSLLMLPARWNEVQSNDVVHLASQFHQTNAVSLIPFKENLVNLVQHLMKEGWNTSVDTATDVLRLAAGLSDGDISLREKPKFRNFKRGERRFLLGMLEGCENIEEDFQRHVLLWKKLLRALRPGDYAKRFPRVVTAYDKLYKGTLPQTFNSRVEEALAKADPEVFNMLRSRPGEFVRRLHVCLLKFGGDAVVEFVSILPNLQVSQLLKVQSYLETVNDRQFRTFAPKGNWTKLQVVENTDDRKLDKDSCKKILDMIGLEISARLSERVPSVNLSEQVKMVKLQTNDSELSPFGRGTVFPIPENINFIRTSSYWEAGANKTVYYDNGFNMFDENWNPVGTVCWDNERPYALKGAVNWSGDPVSAKNVDGKACQMIDLYLDKLEDAGVRYAVWNMLCWSHEAFSECKMVAGALQWGEKPEEGNLFDPARCQFMFRLTGESYTKYIAYVDVKERKLVYLDANLYARVSSAKNNEGILSEKMPAFVEYLNTLPSVYDLFKHQDHSDDGMPVLYSNEGVELDGAEAYVFSNVNEKESYIPFDVNELL